MCPVCLSTAMLIAGSVSSSGGLAAIVIKKFGGKIAIDNKPASTPSKLTPTKIEQEKSS
ncbi:MAG TPA: hypothetical protein VK722_09285 [Candidatus Aquilonibacter sp.]|jgi:hypothetical protein|nr:hypothetical protein [Candidatus Aquilonibacter sp.]